jgi:hypothetical protein
MLFWRKGHLSDVGILSQQRQKTALALGSQFSDMQMTRHKSLDLRPLKNNANQTETATYLNSSLATQSPKRSSMKDQSYPNQEIPQRRGIGSRQELFEWAKKDRLYALIDPFFDIPVPVERIRLEMRDTDPVFYDLIAWDQVTYEPPTLCRISVEALEWLINSLSTERWGLFLTSQADLPELCGHLQKFVIAKGPDANPYFLRFHDASVLEVLLRTWSDKEKSVFFGPIAAFGLPDLDSMAVEIFPNPFRTGDGFHPYPEDCLIQLREAQLKECSDAIDRDLIKVIYWHLRNHHSKAVQFLDRIDLEARIQVALSHARAYGLSTVSDLAGFTALMFELSPNFDTHPSFRRVLEDPSVPPEGKMKRLSQTITDRDWQEAIGSYDRSFWRLALPRRKNSA